MFFTNNIIDRIDPDTPKEQKFAEWSRFVDVLNDELTKNSRSVRNEFIDADGSLTPAGKQLPADNLALLKRDQAAYLNTEKNIFQPGAR